MILVPKKIYLGLALFSIALFAISLWHRLIHIDDAWLAEQVYWLVHDGKVRSELFRGFLGHEQKLFVWHKLFIWQGALLTKLFGFNLYILKSLSLVYLALLIFIFRKIFDFYKVESGFWFLSLAMIFTSSFVFELGFTFRPDLAVTAFGLLSFYSLKKSDDKVSLVLLSGIFAGLATASHLNGLIFIGAGCVILALRRNFVGFICFCMLGGAISLFYFHDVRSTEEFSSLVLQFRHDPAVSDEFYGAFHYLWKLFDEQRRFFHSPVEIVYSLMLLSFFLPNIRKIYARDRELVIYTLSLCVLLALLSHGKTSKYLIYSQPLFLLMIAMAWSEKVNAWKVAVLCLYVGTTSFYNIKDYVVENHNEIYQNTQLGAFIPDGARVVAHLPFIFNNIERLGQIQCLQVYEFFVSQKMMRPEARDFFRMASHFDRDYILINTAYMHRFKVEARDYPPYKLIGKDILDNALFKRMPQGENSWNKISGREKGSSSPATQDFVEAGSR